MATVENLARRATHYSRAVLAHRVTGNPVGLLARVWAWQLWRRVMKRPVAIRCAEGTVMVAPPWSRMAGSIVGQGLWERTYSLFVVDLLRPGDLFVDVGANIGFYTLIAARRGARVEAFEPTDEAAGCCERSLAMNHLHATVHRAACGAEPGATRFTTGLDMMNHVTTGPGLDVPVVTLDQALPDVEPTLAMFKVDTEGHDLDVLRGAMGVIERLKPVILVEVLMGDEQGPGRGEDVMALIQPHGYRSYLYDAKLRLLREIPAGSRSRRNILLIADARLATVRERVSDDKRPVLRPPRVSWFYRADLAGQA